LPAPFQQLYLLPTKTHVPRDTRELVRRPRIQAKLSRSRQEKLIWVSAPAGSGKSLAMADFLNAPTNKDSLIAWYSLDDTDNETQPFLAYLLQCLSTFIPVDDLLQPILSGIGCNPEHSIQQLLSRLGNADLRQPCILVLDDWHVINRPQIQSLLQTFIEFAPAFFCVYLLSREVCPWPLQSKWVLKGWFKNINHHDLAFNTGECRELFYEQGQDLSADKLAPLVEQLEGWVAGLQMAAISRSSLDNLDQASLLNGPASLTDFFTHELLAHQSPQLQQFLIQSSLLDRFNLPLLRAICPELPCEQLLKEAQAKHLFIVSLDNTATWFRYHHLFAEYLRAEVDRDSQDKSVRLKQATEHCVEQNLKQEALGYALRSQNEALISRCLVDFGHDLEQVGLNQIIMACLDVLGENSIVNNFELANFTGWFLFNTQHDDPAKIKLMLSRAYQNIKQPSKLQADNYHIICCNLSFEQEHYDEAESFLSKLKLVSPDEITEEHHALRPREQQNLTHMTTLAAELAQNKGNIAEALDYFLWERTLTKAFGLRQSTWCLQRIGSIYAEQGQTQLALETMKDGLSAIDQYGIPFSVSSWCMNISCAEIHLGRLEYDKVQHYCQVALERAHVFKADDLAMVPNSILLKMATLQHQPNSVLTKQVEHSLLTNRFHSHSIAQGDAALIGYWIETQDFPALSKWVNKQDFALNAGNEMRVQTHMNCINLCRAELFLAQNNQNQTAISRVIHNLNALIAAAERYGLTYQSVHQRLVLSIAYHIQGSTKLTHSTLCEALNLAQQFSLPGTVLEYETELAPILNNVINSDEFESTNGISAIAPKTKQFVQRLIAIQKSRDSDLPPAIKAIPLTPKEWQIVQLINKGKTNSEIAKTLFVSEGTVKSHINRTYRKLEVSNRTEAKLRVKSLLTDG